MINSLFLVCLGLDCAADSDLFALLVFFFTTRNVPQRKAVLAALRSDNVRIVASILNDLGDFDGCIGLDYLADSNLSNEIMGHKFREE